MNQTFFAEDKEDQLLRNKYFSDYSYKGIMIEVGGATPEFISTSRHFTLNGWRTIIVEPNPIFAKQHRNIKNEIYEYAASETDEDNVNFTIVHIPNHDNITDHSFSSLNIKETYKAISNGWVNSLNKTYIKVKQRRLDTIIKEANIKQIDILSVDTEGWEIEVMNGLSSIIPKVIMLENIFNDQLYRNYMTNRGYKFDIRIGNNDIYLS